MSTPCSTRTAIRDERYAGHSPDVSFQGELRPEQQTAADAMLAHETGVLAATTAFGKTVIAAWLIAQRGVSTLVVVHRRQLLDQWIERLFLYRRLETLSETRGRFGLNVPLPIAFDGLGRLEVDLLCADARVAVELDGAQHLADPVAYRRDRRNDQFAAGERLSGGSLPG